jgi:alpha-N-arabinofuranosidase
MPFNVEERVLTVNPAPQFELSPNLYMQFMEPLGTTDGSVEAAWDFERQCWREDVIKLTRELAPPLIRWGGVLSAYYRWREAVGPREQRIPMLNLEWGGYESNQIGTAEFIDFCRQVGAEPFININFESDGKRRWSHPAVGGPRSAGPEEAAAWVDYCNNPDNRERIAHGAKEPYQVRLWQIGNETSYGSDGFDCETAARKTLEFAKAMRKADPGIELMGWGDSGWARRMLEVAGEELQYLDFHLLFGKELTLKNSPLVGRRYLEDIDETWHHLMNAYTYTEDKLQEMREQIAGYDIKLALCESHFAIFGRNRSEVLSTWAAGVSNARILNTQARNGDILKIANLSDFCGTRWLVNSVMIPTPLRSRFKAYLMPVARVTELYRKHTGREAIQVTAAPAALDITASRTGDRIYLHVVNTHRTRSVDTRLAVEGMTIKSGKIFELAADPLLEIQELTAGMLTTATYDLFRDGRWSFPPASVSALELEVGAKSQE